MVVETIRIKKTEKTAKEKILFLTNYCPHYRLPVFEALSRQYKMHFVFTEDGSRMGWNNYGTIRYSLRLSKFALILKLLRTDYDVLISGFPSWNALFEFLIIKLRKKKLVIWVEEWHQPLTLTRRTLTPILKFIARRCNAIIVCGSKSNAHMLDYGSTSEKIFTAANASWVEVPSEHAYSTSSKLESGNRRIILYLGRLASSKGVDYLIKAFSVLQKERDDIKLIIVGDGDSRSALEQLSRELGIQNIEFVGACNPKDRFYYYNICDVFVLPSIWSPVQCEAWGLVLNEAMQFGKLIIATDAVGAAYDLIRQGVNGFIVKNRDVDQLYQALKILDDPTRAQKMGEEGKRIIEEYFTYEQMIKGFKGALAFVGVAGRRGNEDRYG